MRVIREGTKATIECNNCYALLEYTKADITTLKPQHYAEDSIHVIFCACCSHEIQVKRLHPQEGK